MSQVPRILIVEDDSSLRDLIRKELEELTYQVEEAGDGRDGLAKALSGSFDLMILDLNLPHMDGLEICRKLRATDESVSILMLTARKDELDRVLGLELGADDYLTKPFAMRELLARVKAILRRVNRAHERTDSAKNDPALSALRFGELEIDLGMRTVTLGSKSLALSSMEFELVAFLASAPGKAFTREELLEQVWGYTAVGYEQNVTTHINRLRRKLETDMDNPRFIKTVRGFGYAFANLRDFAE